MNTRKLTRAAIFCAVALAVHVIEARIPPLIPVPGVKPGLANAVTLYALYALGTAPAAMALAGRIVLGAAFSGGFSAFLYSAAGGLLSFTATLLVYRKLGRGLSFVVGAVGGAAHNIAQLGVAVLVTGTPEIALYLPVLIVAGIIAGAFTGFLAGIIKISIIH